MAAPTRAQIEAWYVLPKYKVEIFCPVYLSTWGWVELSNDNISKVSGSIQGSQENNGLSFGASVDVSFTVEVARETTLYYVGEIWKTPLRSSKLRVSYGFDTSDFIFAAEGIVTSIEVTETEITLTCSGFVNVIKDTKFYSNVFYNRPVATLTSSVTQENPDLPNYNAGMLNEIFWRSGGRPVEQYGTNGYTDDNTVFWYSCDQSLFNPEWIWINGDNLLDDALTLVRSVGGQLYQDNNGVMRYVQPLLLADGSSNFTYTTDHFSTVSFSIDSSDMANKLTSTYTPRRLEPMQEVYSDTTPRLLESMQTMNVVLETQLPIYEYDSITVQNCIKAMNFNGDSVVPGIEQIKTSAQRIEFVLTNATPYAMVIHSIIIKGRPLGARDEGQVSFTRSGDRTTPEKLLETNVYIQNEAHARKIAQMTLDFYAEARTLLHLKGAIYDTDRFVGETVHVDYPAMQIYNQPCRIVAITHDLTGVNMDVDLVSLDVGIPVRSNMFIIGTVYSNSDNKQVSY